MSMDYPRTYEEALAYEAYATELVVKNKEANTQKRSEETLSALRKVQALVPPGRYKHFKGGEYDVLEVLEDVNGGECYVRYAADYGIYKGESALRVLVGKDSFLAPVMRDEYTGVRFEKL